jgi:subtilase family serine protease/flagellar hook assembly protein FlgD
LQRLLALQNADGGWGVAARYASNPLDTALAMQALLSFEGTLAQGKLDAATAFLAAQQNSDGGWGNLAGGASRTAVSSTVLQAMKGRAGTTALAARAIAFLATRQNTDGGFGDGASTVHDTANVLAAMLSQNALGSIRSAPATAYISSSQQVDGSWDGSVYSTALAVKLLKSAGLFNWTATALTAQPAAPLDGQQAVLTFKVANSGTAPAPAGVARAYDGDPAAGRQIGSLMNVPALVAGDSIELRLLWDTRDKAGAHTIFVVVDPDNSVSEASKTDNRAQVNVTVREAPVPVELTVNAGDITVTPARPNKLPSLVAISAQIANIGRSDAGNVRVVLRAAGPEGAVIDEKIVSLLGRSQQVVNFAATLTRAGAVSYTVAIDPDAKVTETDRTNNTADVTVETVPSLDVEVRDLETTIDRNPIHLGADAIFSTRIRNGGTQDTPPFKVRYSLYDGSKTIELASRVIQLAAGKDSNQEVVWRSDAPGAFLFKVELDPENLLAEIDEANNATQLPFTVIDSSGINLSVGFKDFVVTPTQVLEGREVRLTQTVRNSGNVAATNVEVGFYDGDPAGGRLIGALQTIASLAPGEAATVQTTWAKYPDAGDHLVFFVADPASRLADQARDDNAAFIVLTPNSLPDLAISAGDVQVTPELPNPADKLTVTATVSNLGKQDAANVVVRAFDGDPAAGKQVGADQVIAALPGLSSQTVGFTYPASGLSGARTIAIVVDPGNMVEEKTKDNNQARRDLIAQSGNFFVTNRYFSPNGDGSKDDTTLGFRLGAATDVVVDVLAKNGKVVRTISGDNLKKVTSGTVVWDGLNARGSLVPDGDYTLRVVNTGGTVLGEAKVTLDTNRSSIMKAIDTPFGLYTNLTCNLNWLQKSTTFTGDEDKAFLEVRDQNDIATDGLYSMLVDGSEPKLLVPRVDLSTTGGEHIHAVSRDGRQVAYNDYVDWTNKLWVMDSDGSNKRSLGEVANRANFVLSADGAAVLLASDGQIVKIPTDGSPRIELVGAGYDYDSIWMAPDGNTALVRGRTYEPEQATYKIVDIATGRVDSLPDAMQSLLAYDGPGFTHIAWSPDAKLIAFSGYRSNMSDDPEIFRTWIVDNQFKVVKTLFYQPADGTPYLPISMTAPTWSADSSEFAYELRYCQTDGYECWDGLPPSRMANGKAAAKAARANTDTADSVLMVANIASGKVELIEASRMPGNGNAMQFHWVPNERTVVRAKDAYVCADDGNGQVVPCFEAIDLDDDGKVTPIFKDWRGQRWYDEGAVHKEMEIDRFLPASAKLSFRSPRASTEYGGSCYANAETDQYLFSSLLNLTADLRAVRSATSGSLVLRGTAADANFARYVIEFATTEAPDAWKAAAPASTTAVSDNVFMNWVPPAYGKYRLRLTVEDLAGNKRQVIRQATWNDSPPVTDMYKDTEFMSPNGDGAKEGVDLHYRVAEPVHLVFNIYDMQQNLVRSVSRDHFTIGQDAVFHWDGRDDRGRTVRDGQYRITVLDFEFFVTLDTAPPLAAVTLGNAYSYVVDGEKKKWTVFAPSLSWTGSDANLSAFAIEKGTGEVPSQWDIAYQWPDRQLKETIPLSADEFVNQHYRAQVEDKAGNHIIAEAPLGAEQVFLTGYAQHGMTRGLWYEEQKAAYPQAQRLGALPEIVAASADPLRLRFAESVRRPVAKVLVQFHALAGAERDLPLATADTLAWKEALVPMFLQGKATGGAFKELGNKPLDHEIMFAWDMADVMLDTDYLVRIKAVDEDGAEVVAVAPVIVRRADLSGEGTQLRIVKVTDQRPGTLIVNAVLTGVTSATSIDLLLQSATDPRYVLPGVVHSVGETIGTYQHYVGVDTLKALDLRLCEPYTLSLRAVLATGETVTSAIETLMPRCLGANWIVAPATALTCDVQPEQVLHVTLLPYSEDGRRLTQLLFGRIEDGREVILNNWNKPAPRQAYTFDIDTAGMAVETLSYFVRVINEDGKAETKQLAIPVSHAPAQARITYPANGQKMCGVRMKAVHDPAQFVRAVGVEAQLASDSNVSVGVEYARAGTDKWTTFSPALGEVKLAGFDGLRAHPRREGGSLPKECSYTDATLCGDFHPVQWSSDDIANKSGFAGAPAQSGNVGYLGLMEQIEGEVSVRLRLFNGAGQQTCSAPVTFDFDNQVRVGTTAVDRRLFSPNAAEGPTVATFTVTPDESVTATLRLYAQVGEKDGQPVFGTVPVRTVADGQQLIAGETSFAWDGKMDAGGLAADGLYQLVAEYTDSCGNVAVRTVNVAMDATAPAVVLAAPRAGGQVGLQASVSGSVQDLHFASYVVEYATSASPDQWVALATRTTPSRSNAAEELAAWNTLGLTGQVTLRVRALDEAGNVTVITAPLTVVDAGKVLSYLEAVPSMFSPNGDGKRDSAAIRFGLLAPANVTLEIRRGTAEGPVVRILMAGEAAGAGAQVKAWDGKNDQGVVQPDGVYAVRASVDTVGELVVNQEEAVLLTLDNTAPQVAVNHPAGDFAPATGNVAITARDDNLARWQVYLSRGATLSNWQLVLEGTGAAVNTAVLDLATLAEGSYAVKVVAQDGAENTAEAIKRFDVDTLAPKVTFATPLAGSYLSARQGPAAVTATVDENNLAQYELRFGPGTVDASAPLLASGATLAGPLAHAWDVGQVPDGAYNLVLSARDRAGQAGSASVSVIVDNTAPLASITAPAQGAYVRGPGIIAGVAFDANLDNYTIEIAAGTGAAATRWSPLAAATKAVENGTLLDWQALPLDGSYTLRLKVLDKTGAVTQALSSVVVDTAAPAAPLNLVAKLENRNDARLTWNASPEADLAGYIVLRNGVRMNAVLLTQNSYVDPALANAGYDYAVKAVDKAGWESAASNVASVSVNANGPTARIVSPARGALVSSLYDIRGIASAPADFKEYRLYVGAGDNPSGWRLLRRSPAPVQMAILASWDTVGLAENAMQSLKLEAEDIYGVIATDIATVTVDNTPPPAPLQLTAQANGADVTLRWTASAAPDLAGYIVLRDERIANAPGPVVGSWKPYLVTNATHIDLQVADGQHRYTVIAMDRAENMSAPSNTASVTIDTRAPHAVLVQPLANAHIGRSTYLLATTPDTDVATVRFQYRPMGSAGWIDVGTATALPYAATLDGAAFTAGDYQLRAVATDLGGRTDPAPAPVTVTFSETPDVITDLKAAVNGGDVTLTWSSAARGLSRYVLERYNAEGGVDRIDVPARAEVRYVDRDLPDFRYRYRVSAVGESGTPNMSSDDAVALVHTPRFAVPFTPTAAAVLKLSGKAEGEGTMTLATSAGVTVPVRRFTTEPDGRFEKTDVAVPMGTSRYELRHVDAAGNISKPAVFEMQRGTPPAKPTGLTATLQDHWLSASWNANSEPDLFGYRVVRNGTLVTNYAYPWYAEASSMTPDTSPYHAIDGSQDTWWSPDTTVPGVEQTLTLQLNQPTLLSEVAVTWGDAGIVTNYDLQIPAGAGNWATLAEVRANDASERVHPVPQVLVSQLRIKLFEQPTVPQLVELQAFGFAVQTDPALEEWSADATEALQVYAVNGFGMESVPAQTTAGAGATPPDNPGPVELPDLAVDAAAIAPESAPYRVGDSAWFDAVLTNAGAGSARNAGAVMRVTDAQGRSVEINAVSIEELGAGASETFYGNWTPEVAGTYTVTVVLDGANAIAETNEANNRATIQVVILPAQPGKTIPLTVTAPPQGGALQLAWTAPAPDVFYRVRSAPAADGPYALLTDWTDTTDWLDETVVNGVRRFYIVSAYDEMGHLVGTSAPVSGVARDTVVPNVPVLLTPTMSGMPITVGLANVDIGGMAEPGATVELVRAGNVVDIATASVATLRKAIGDVGQVGNGGYDVADDGRMVASTAGSIIDVDSGAVRTVPELQDANAVRWSHRAGLLAAVTYDSANYTSSLRVYSPVDKAFVQSSALTNVQRAIAWSHDDRQIAVVGQAVTGEEGLWLFDRVTGTERLLLADRVWSFDASLAWTPDGQHLALARNGMVEVVATGDGSTVFSAGQTSAYPSWSSDGKRLIYQAGEPWNTRSIGAYTLADATTLMLSDGSVDTSMPLWSGAAGEFIVRQGDTAVLHGADGAAKATLVDAYYDGGHTTLSGMLWYQDGATLYRASGPGSFGFAKVRLNSGANLFAARATKSTGTASALSPAISITLGDGTQPDLAAALDDVIVLPSAPMLGEATRITATIRNRGAAAAANVTATLALRSPAGVVTTLAETTIGALGAGASSALTADWTPAQAGQYSLVLALDANDSVRESNESNNVATRTVGVASSALPTLGVTLDAAVYGANAPVAGKVTLANAGPEIAGTLVLRIEDLGGYLVATLPAVNVTLPYGQSATYPANWNTGAILAGDYRLVAQLRNAGGMQLAAGSAALRIGAARDVGATLAVEFAQYQQHASAAIGATVTLGQGNAGLDGATALIQVADSTDKVVFETALALGNLSPGVSVNVNTVWNTGANAIGDYRVKLAVQSGDATVATALAPVAIVAADGTLAVSGTVRPGSATVAVGDRLDVAYTVRSDGAALAGLPLTITIVDAATQAPLAGFSARADLARGATTQGTAPFTVGAWPLTTLQVVLAAEVNGRQQVLQRATVRTIDRTPPVAAFALAAQSGTLVASGAMPVIVKATDTQSLVTRVEYAFSTSAWMPFALQSRGDGLFGMTLAGIADGPLQVQARAFDSAGNQSEIVNLALTVDNTAPAIQVAGVVDGGRYTDAVTPVVTVQDANLKSTVITLDGAPFVSGARVAGGGAHVLHIDALDAAGNASARSVAFQIASAPPVLALTSPAPGALLRTPFGVTMTASSEVSTLAGVEYQVDAGAWLPAAAAGAGQYQATVAALTDGMHKLAARATDAAQQVTTLAPVDIDVDNTAPLIAVRGVVDGASYAGSATPVIDVSDAHPDAKLTVITLDATGSVSRAFVSGQPVTAIGSHVLVVSATDKLGNKAVTTVRFTITPALTGTLVAAPKPVAIGEPLTLAATVNNGGAGALAAVQYRVVIVDVASGKVVQQFDDAGALAPGASWQRGFAWTAAGTVGASLRASLTATTGGDTREIGSDTFTLAAAPVRLTGSVTVAPKEVESGAVLAITRKLVNGGTAQNGIALQLTIVNQQTGAVVFTHDETVNLAANASWTGNLGWTASGAAGTAYFARLTAVVGGNTVVIGQDSFVVTAPASRIDIDFGTVDKQRILVLSQCKRAESAGLGTCGASTIVVDDAATLARCDTARATAVVRYLSQVGVASKVVTTEAEFVREIRTGGYTGYWVSGGGTKLRQPLQAELNAGLQLGESLLADGMHDLRNGDRALQELLSVYVSGPEQDANGRNRWSLGSPVSTWLKTFLGVYTNGTKPAERSGTLRMAGELYPVNEFDIWGDKLQVDALENARVEAVIRAAAGNDDGHHHEHGFWHHHHDGHGFHHGRDDIHRNCDPETSSRTGIVSGSFGAGRTLYFGFDWVASLQAGAANARWLDVGRTSFGWLKAGAPDAGTALVAGDVITRKIALRNTGKALAMKVVAQLPRGAKALVSEPAAKTTESAGVVTVTWQLNLAAGEAKDLALQLKLPLDAGTHDLRYTVSETGTATTVLGGDTVTLQVEGVTEWAGAVQEAVRQLDVSAANVKARDDVLRWTARALQSSKAGNDARALRELVMAQTRLDNIGGVPLAPAQQALARMIRALERRQP